MQDNLESKFQELDRLFASGGDVSEILKQFSPSQLNLYLDRERTDDNFIVYLWTYHVSWGFYCSWSLIRKEWEKREPTQEEIDSVATDFDVDTPLGQLSLFTPHDCIEV